MLRVDESKQNKGVNNNTQNKQMAIDMEYQNRLNHPRFKSPYFGAKYQQRVIPVRTLNGVRDVFVDNRGTIKQGGHTNSKLYNYSNKNRNPTKQTVETVEYIPQRSNYVYHATPKLDYKKAFYKYPQYRKWDSKLQESLKHEWTTDFSVIPGRKIDNIQYHWNKYTVPTGVITGTIGGTIDMYNNMNTFDIANPYYLRQLNQELGN